MKYSFELYGGPLDGALVSLPSNVLEGQQVDIDMAQQTYTPEVGGVVSKPCGVSVFVMRKGRLEFMEHKLTIGKQ